MSCGQHDEESTSGSTKGNKGQSGKTTTVNEGDEQFKIQKAKSIFYMLPSPIETASLLKKAGANYNKDFLNPIENVTRYETLKSKAINLGIYGADLSYTSIFDQTQESMLYATCTKKLADQLGISDAFNAKTMERIEANINNRDSMLGIISDSYFIADAHLKDNERGNISGLIIAGGWIEGLYIAAKLFKSKLPPNQEIIKRIAEQKYSLNDLIDLVSSYPPNDDLTQVLNDLNRLKDIYDQMEVVKIQGQNSTDPETGVMTIGGGKEIKISEVQLNAIINIITEIRNSYIE